MPSPKDVVVVLPVQKNGTTYVVGINTAGDIAAELKANLEFLEQCNCDVIICAARLGIRKKNTLTIQETIACAVRITAPAPHQVQTTRLSKPTQIQIDNEHARIAALIWQAIP
jgi:hypothetical protein